MPTAYIRSVLGPREPVLEEILRRSLLNDRMPTIQVDDNAGRVLQLLTALRRPRHVIEIGTLFGYSTIHLARGLPEGGHVTTLEVDPRAASVARRNFETAGVSDRIEIVVGDAAEHLATVAPESVGMIFIDADKTSYVEYLKLCVRLLEAGGLLVADDAFGQGDYQIEAQQDGDGGREAATIRAYAHAVGRSTRLMSAFVGTETGLLISLKA